MTIAYLEAELASSPTEDDGPARFVMRANTGSLPMTIKGFPYPVVLELSGVEIPNQRLPTIIDHDRNQRFGHTERIQVSDGIIVEGIASGSSKTAIETANDMKNGIPFQASVGAHVLSTRKVPQGKTAFVNGHSFEGPILIATKSRLREVTVTLFGADRNTSTTIAASEDTQMSYDELLASLNLSDEDREKLLEAHMAELESSTTPNSTTPLNLESQAEQLREMQAAEFNRLAAIKALANNPDFQSCENLPSLVEAAIKDGTDPDQFELMLRRNSRPSVGEFNVQSRGNSITGEVMEAALLMSNGGLPSEFLESQYSEEVLEAASRSEMAGAGIHYLMDTVQLMAGKPWTGASRSDTAYINAAMECNRLLEATEGFSTFSVPGILSNVANKTLLASYDAQETTWRQFCRVGSVRDFKQVSRYRMDSHFNYKRVDKQGEIKHGGISEAEFGNKADTYGVMLTLDRRDIVNDDLGAFLALPSMMGTAAAIRIEEMVYKLILDDIGSNGGLGTFWTSAKGNRINNPLDLTGLQVGSTAFNNFVDSNSKPITIRPTQLLTGTAQEVIAWQLYNDLNVMPVATGVGAAAEITPAFTTNQHRGRYRPTISAYLNNTAIKDSEAQASLGNQSDTIWMLFANPAIRAAIEVVFLNGRQIPFFDTQATAFNTLGVQMRSYHDFGMALQDDKAALLSTGDGA